MTTTAITGKSATFTYGADEGTAQITSANISDAGTSNTIQTLGGSVTVSQGIETTVSCDFLFDGNVVGGGFYAALKAALTSGAPGSLAIDADGGAWVGDAIVTSLSADIPADDAVTCSAEFVVSGDFPFTAPIAAGAFGDEA
jgi:hypothetical protein